VVRTSKYQKFFFYQNFQTKMSNSATLTNEIKQRLYAVVNSLIDVDRMIERAIDCHEKKYTESVLHNVQDAYDDVELITQYALTLPNHFARLRQKVIIVTTDDDDKVKEAESDSDSGYPLRRKVVKNAEPDSDSGGWHCATCDCRQCNKQNEWSEQTVKYEKDGGTVWMDPTNGRVRIIGPIPSTVFAKLRDEADEKIRKLMKTSMTKELPPTTPTRRIKPTVCPPAPKKKSKWRAGNRYSALASSSNEPYSIMGSSSRSKTPPSPPQDRRRGGRPCTPGCCAPPTPQVSAVSPPPIDWGEYDPVPDAIDLNDYDMWGRKIHYDLF